MIVDLLVEVKSKLQDKTRQITHLEQSHLELKEDIDHIEYMLELRYISKKDMKKPGRVVIASEYDKINKEIKACVKQLNLLKESLIQLEEIVKRSKHEVENLRSTISNIERKKNTCGKLISLRKKDKVKN